MWRNCQLLVEKNNLFINYLIKNQFKLKKL